MIGESMYETLQWLLAEHPEAMENLPKQSGLSRHYLMYLPGTWNPKLETLCNFARHLRTPILEIVRRTMQIQWESEETDDHSWQDFTPAKHLAGFYPEHLHVFFGPTMRSLRHARGLSVDALAKRTGMDNANLLHRETGCNGPIDPTITYIDLVARGIGVSSLVFIDEMMERAYAARTAQDSALHAPFL